MAKKIYIGAGHGKSTTGGYDPGAVASGLTEEKLNEAVATAAAVALRRAGFEVKVDASAEQYNYLEAVKVANAWPADYAMEIHHNVVSAGGTMALVHLSASDSTKNAARSIVNALVAALGTRSLGVLPRDREYFNRATTMPSCIPEVACLDGDAAKIKAPGYATKAGEAIAKGLCAHFGVAYVPPTPPVVMVDIVGHLPVLKEGMKDPIAGMWYVSRLQLLLGVTKSGVYDPDTVTAVKAYNTNTLKRATDGKTVDVTFWKRLIGLKA